MAVTLELLAFSCSASAHQLYYGAGNGEVNLFSNTHERAVGIDQFQNGDDFQCEVVCVLEILLRKSQTEIKDSVVSRTEGIHDVNMDIELNGRLSKQREVLDLVRAVMTCDDEGDGGHRCPYFPCPYCHRHRSIFVPESNTSLKTCEEESEVDHQERLFVNGSKFVGDDSRMGFNRDSVNNQSVSVVTWDDEGDGGHRCPYFPCPYCHRSRSIFVPKTDCKVSYPNLDCKSNLNMNSHVHVDHSLMFRNDDQSNGVPVLQCPDKGHTCPYFPCPICHRTR